MPGAEVPFIEMLRCNILPGFCQEYWHAANSKGASPDEIVSPRLGRETLRNIFFRFAEFWLARIVCASYGAKRETKQSFTFSERQELVNSLRWISRRTALTAGITALLGGLTATKAAADTDPDIGKQSKVSVQYRYHPAGNGNHCAICANFLAPDNPDNPTHKDARCRVVAGVIDPNGYCSAFAKKKKAA